MINTTDPKRKAISDKRVKLIYDNRKWKEEYGDYFNTILLFITGKCNLRCEKCFNCGNMSKNNEMTLDYIENIIDNNPLVDKYDVMGGEPLIHPELDKIFRYMDAKNKKIGLYTNGILLNKLATDYKNLKVNMAFHSIFSDNKSEKPIAVVVDNINYIQNFYPTKIVYLMKENNKSRLGEFVDYVESNLPKLSKITIGLIRDELDYYNDEAENVTPLEEYANIINNFVSKYKGRLNIDIFSEGILHTDELPSNQPRQLNRFRSVFPNSQYVDCLYDVALSKKESFDISKPLPFNKCNLCPKTGRDRCITDKIKLKKV